MLADEAIRRAVRAALEEDVGPGDITTRALVDETARARGRIVAREALIVAGMAVARRVFLEIDPGLAFRAGCDDGDPREAGECIATIDGPARGILTGERTALNFLQRMCGIATAVRRWVRRAEGTGVQIADTRKTAPGLRALDKYAVLAGGGTNHRAGLYDAVLIKDNHWRLAGGVTAALRRARRALGAGAASGRIEIEVGTLDEVREALAAGADALLLDNMEGDLLARAVETARGRAFVEVSGGVREEDLERLLALRVDRISIGALTHSARAADIALEVESP